MMMEDTLLMFVADALNMPLHQNANGKYMAGLTRSLKLGPWGSMEAAISVCSDVIEKDHAAFFVRITPCLWLYMISTEKVMTATVFDGNALKWHVKDMANIGGKSIEDTWNTIKGVSGDKFMFETSTHAWRKVNADNLDKDLSGKDAERTITRAEKP